MPIPLMNVVPIIADAYPGSHNMGPDQFRDVLSPRTRAVVVANIGGYPADLDPIIEIAREHDVVVIEDCAQSHGARYRGRLCGSIADFATFSTMSGKHHATGGQGGVVFTRDEEMYWRVKRFADRGKPYNLETSDRVLAGLNLNLTDFAAAIGRVQIGRLNGFTKARRAVMSTVIDELAGANAVTPGYEVPDTESSYWFAIFQIDASKLTVDLAKFTEAMTAEGIPARPDYGATLHAKSAWFVNRRIFGKSGYPWAAPEYTGDKDPHFEVPNAVATLESTFHVDIHERYGEEEARDIARAILKVEAAYLA
jgi:dTDP-4-amino-4,6-dideoxygalactose transaminase